MTSTKLFAIALCSVFAAAPAIGAVDARHASAGSAASIADAALAASQHRLHLALQGATPEGEAAGEAPAASETPAEGAAESIDAALPPILRSEADLPEPVRETRAALMAAARSGNMEELRVLMQAQTEPPSVSFGDPGDPIDYLMSLSGDADGREILAILLEVLESGFSRVSPGTPDELYVWPYFAQYPLEALSPEQIVEMFTLLTAADYEDMKSYGSYTFFRVGIAPDGRWLFFVAGD